LQSYASWNEALREPGLVDLIGVTGGPSGLVLTLVPFAGARGVYDPRNASFTSAEVRFKLPRAYRCIDEGYRLGEPNIPESQPTSFVYTVSNSSFLTEFEALSEGQLSNFGLVHWFVPSANECADIISESPPEVRLVRGPAV
jgi:hypothetical protein